MNGSARIRVIQVALITAIALFGDAMLFIVLPLYYSQFGLTALWQIGLLLSINRLIRLPLNPLVAWFYRRFSLRTGLLIAMILASLTTFSYGVFPIFWVLFIARMLWGVAWSLLRMGGFLTIIEVSSDDNRGKHVGMYNGLWGIGGLVGMLAGGLLADQMSIMPITTVFALCAAACIPVVWRVIPNVLITNDDSKQAVTNDKFSFTSYHTIILLTSLGMGFLIMGLFASTLSPLIETYYIEELTVLGVVIGAATVAGVLQAVRWSWDPFVAPLVGKWMDRLEHSHYLLFVPLSGGAIVFFLIGWTSELYLLLLLLVIFQLISTFFSTTVDTIATEAASKTDRVKFMMWHTIMVDTGAAVGPLLSYLLLSTFDGSLSIVYFIASVIFLAYACVWAYAAKKIKTKRT
ncbi:MFS transporter [Geomicrobium sp. JSM 1781026]|uniref:MFS transporter n=1 Tax=Geomicrobium sp. JSM 1781026 TaxID=3344580 RepID=UPI0035BFE98D